VRQPVRVELFNTFNNVNYGNPGASFGAATFAYQLGRKHAADAAGVQADLLIEVS
jgi:high-affinity nickel permease